MYSQDAPDCNFTTDWHGIEEWRYARLRARAFVTKNVHDLHVCIEAMRTHTLSAGLAIRLVQGL